MSKALLVAITVIAGTATATASLDHPGLGYLGALDDPSRWPGIVPMADLDLTIESGGDYYHLRDALMTRHAGVVACYTAALRKHPGLQGNFELDLDVAADGTVTITLGQPGLVTAKTRSMTRCVQRALRGLKADATDEETRAWVTYGFIEDG